MTLVAVQPNILVVHPAVPANSVRELIALAGSRAGQFNYASSGSGAAAHLVGEWFKAMTHVDMVQVPALPDLRERLAGLGAEVTTGTPREFADYIARETPKWAEVVKNSEARAD